MSSSDFPCTISTYINTLNKMSSSLRRSLKIIEHNNYLLPAHASFELGFMLQGRQSKFRETRNYPRSLYILHGTTVYEKIAINFQEATNNLQALDSTSLVSTSQWCSLSCLSQWMVCHG